MKIPTAEVIGIPVTALSLKEQVDLMINWAQQRSSRIVCVANVHMLVESHWNSHLHKILQEADLVTPDGMPLVWMMRVLGIKTQERVAGMDILLASCQQASNHKIPVYLFGSTQEVLTCMKNRLESDFPNLKIAGLESPPFRPFTEMEISESIERINSSGAGLLFVSLGCPKQELWMANQLGKIQAVMIGLGGVFPVYTGDKRYAPQWIRDSGLEWLYRLLQEPKRLFIRYFTTIPPFVWLALRQLKAKYTKRQALKLD
ncbi:glycosyltransferase [filamentous cyanobacterium CCT1]|nr:glycosyltransferase [filamentous cyanobacterium CCT1]PSN81094.1 glycosyltransferase [filamentous cyanobacterium CCP4]